MITNKFVLLITDYSKGFGGKYGVETDRQDKSAKGWSEQTKPELHASQTDHKKGFGGKFGVETDKVDKSAKGWSEQTKPELHPSQMDHKKGFGGKFGVETDKQDQVSAAFEVKITVGSLHSSQNCHILTKGQVTFMFKIPLKFLSSWIYVYL